LNQRLIEVTRGTNGYEKCLTQPITVFSNLVELQQDVAAQPGQWQLSQEIYDENSNLIFKAFASLDASNLQRIAKLNLPIIRAYNNTEPDKHYIVASWHQKTHAYESFAPADETAYLAPVETPPVSDELQAMIGQVQSALPAVIALTNQLAAVLTHSAEVTSNLDDTIVAVRPLLTKQLTSVLNNSAEVTSNLNIAIVATQPVLTNANLLVAHMDTNVTATLISLADITSNLAVQVQSNSNMLSGISKTILDYDDFVQGLKHHWLLRSAFKNENKTNSPPATPLVSPRRRN
jgi:hypothetical protein